MSMWPEVMFIGSNIVTLTVLHIFYIKNCEFGFWPSKSSKVKSDCANRKLIAAFKRVLPGIQPRIGHRFQDISNQRIVTLTFNLSRSSKVKPVGSTSLLLPFLTYFTTKSMTLILTPQGHPRSNLTVPIDSPSALSYMTSVESNTVYGISHHLATNHPCDQQTNQRHTVATTCVAIGPVCNTCSLGLKMELVSTPVEKWW